MGLRSLSLSNRTESAARIARDISKTRLGAEPLVSIGYSKESGAILNSRFGIVTVKRDETSSPLFTMIVSSFGMGKPILKPGTDLELAYMVAHALEESGEYIFRVPVATFRMVEDLLPSPAYRFEIGVSSR